MTSEVRSNNYLDGAGGNTATINGIPLRQGILDPENRIINGAFDFWQRGTSFTAAAYGADRWINITTGGGTVTMSRQSFALGDTLGSNNPTYFLRQTVSGQTLASHAANITQRIEGVRSYAGQTITLLGWARRSSGAGNIVADAFQVFGTGGSPSGVVDKLGTTTIALSTSWTAFAVNIPVPSVTGKTLGSNGDDYFAIRFWTSAGSDFNSYTNSLGLQTIGVDLWGVHIKLGTQTTAATALYKQPELQPELARCQRYYEIMPPHVSGYGIIATYYSASDWRTNWTFKVVKRATPALGTVTWGGVTPSGIYSSSYMIQYYGTNGYYSTSTLTADAEL